MKKLILSVLVGLFGASLLASSILPHTLNEQVDGANAIFRGTVLQNICFRSSTDGGIYTKTILHVDEGLKGTFPTSLQVIHRGGTFEGEGEVVSSSPRFTKDEEILLFLAARPDGTLYATDGGAGAVTLHRQDNGKTYASGEDALLEQVRQRLASAPSPGIDTTSQAANSSGYSSLVGGLLEDANHISSRFTAPDRGEKIPYIVDAQALPSGITLNQALGAVSNAFRAWTQVSSAQFVYEGLQNFGMAAANVNSNDFKIRVQLHDLYNYITEANVLGKGGRNYSIPGHFPNGGMGGNIAGKEFFANTRGSVVLEHTSSSMQNLSTFTEVLCHEIGHVLSLDHSSENSAESDNTLRQSIMYFTVHADGRGATLGSYDAPKIQLVHPFNTPPYGYDRIIEALSGPTMPNITGINEVELRGYDLQGTTLSIVLGDQYTNNGSFALAGTKLKFTPRAWFADSSVVDPATTSYKDLAYVRFSDGVNGSPYVQVRTIRFYSETLPSGNPDGMPDSWMTTYFGNANPNSGANHKATDDFDGDGSSNFNEFLCGTDPTSSSSVLKITGVSPTNLQFIAKAYNVYELYSSTNLSNWQLATNPVVPTNTSANVTLPTDAATAKFFRIQRVP